MKTRTYMNEGVSSAIILILSLSGMVALFGQQPEKKPDNEVPSGTRLESSTQPPLSSTEQGQAPLDESFDFDRRRWRLEKRRDAIRDTEFKFNLRSFYFDRRQFDGTQSQAWAVGGWAGLKTGYFLDHVSFGVTGYTSQKLIGDDDTDGTLLLEPQQGGYSVLGEAYVDFRIIEDLNLYVGRKEFDTPFINRNDTRMTPNTFEAIVLQGKSKLGKSGATLKYGAGYFDRIKERNSDEFVSMAKDAGVDVNRGVYTAGALFEMENFSIGAIDYYSPDIINIGYAETKVTLPIHEDWKPKLAAQVVDQRNVGNNFLDEDKFSVQQFGLKAELPVKKALFTIAYTLTTDGANVRSPWGGYPGYTSVQVQDFNRAGENAFMARASYEFTKIKGLSTYALAVFGTDPADLSQYQQNEYNANIQWAPPEGFLKGFSVRVRYALVQQDGGDVNDLKDFRVICNYAMKF